MERRGHGQQQRALGASCLRQFPCAFDGRFRAGDDDLSRSIEVGRLDHLPLGGLETDLTHGVGLQPHDGGHCPFTRGHRLLHRLGTKTHQRHGIAEGQRACRDQGGILAKAVSSDQRGLRSARRQPGAIDRDPRRQHQRLSVDGQGQALGRPIADHRPQILTQRSGRFGEGFTNHGRLTIGGHHAHRLRTLPGKHQRKCHACSPPLRN